MAHLLVVERVVPNDAALVRLLAADAERRPVIWVSDGFMLRMRRWPSTGSQSQGYGRARATIRWFGPW